MNSISHAKVECGRSAKIDSAPTKAPPKTVHFRAPSARGPLSPLTTRERIEAFVQDGPVKIAQWDPKAPDHTPDAAEQRRDDERSELAVPFGEDAWTMQARIARHAIEAAVSDPSPPASRTGRNVGESALAASLELVPELEPEEAIAPAVVRDSERRHLVALATVVPERAEPAAAPPSEDSVPEPRRRPTLTIVPSEGPEELDAPAHSVETRARGPPEPADAIGSEVALSHTSIIQTKLVVSSPGDPLEHEADAVAARVLSSGVPARPSGSRIVGGRLQRAATRARGPPAFTRRPLPRTVTSVVASPGGGSPLSTALRARIEPHVGVDLSHARVRRDPAAAAAALDLHARAFTSGSTIFLAAESSPGDLRLMAHEATHVAQQQTDAAARTTLMRDLSAEDLVPDWILDGVRTAVRAIPGYTLLTYITGTDPLTDAPVRVDRQVLIDTLLTYGPFGPAVGPVLQAIDVLGDIFAFVSEGLAENDLTLARIGRDIDSAWDEISVTNGIAGNAAIVRRYVDAFLRDVRRFVDSIVARVLEIVRSVVAEVAEPLLETPEIAPVWSLAKKVLHYDPLRGVAVEAPTAEIIADFLRLIGQEQRLAQMEERGTLQETADWLDTQFATFASLITELGTLFSDAWAAIQPQNLPDLMTNLESLAQRAFGFVQRVGDFAATVILKILEIIKDALLGWLSEHAHTIPGFHLLTVILGQNPFTGETVERTAENLIKGFITLLPGGEETYNQLAESGVIGEAAGRIEGEMARLGISLEMITGLFHGIWDSLTLDDLLDPIGAFVRILDLFGEPLSRLVEFVGVVIEVVITLVLRLMNFPSDLLGSIIANALQAIEDIKRDPVAFLKNMLEAVKLGFSGFFDNILTYLLQGLADWLFRGLRALGITIPTDFSLQSILGLVLQVLGITVEGLWTKLGEHIGPERVEMIRGALDQLAGAWQFIKDVQEGGIGAVWRYVTDQLSGLWDALLDMAKDWIMTTIVQRVTARLLSMLDPTGVMAVVNSFIAFFAAVQSAIEYLREILEIVNRYVMTFAQVAAGNIVPGAQMLERGLASAIPVAIGFLANQVGLGNVPEKVVEIIQRLRELVDQALDWLIEQALRLGQAALNALGLGPRQEQPEPSGDPQHDAAVTAGFAAIDAKEQEYVVNGEISQENAILVAAAVKADHPVFTRLEVVDGGDNWEYSWAASAGGSHSTAATKAGVDPGVSAPGLGRIGTHGSKPPSLRTGPNIHWLESEHVIPFATGKRLWQMVNLIVPGRGGREDRGQTTIMIYYEAARFKTPADNELSEAFEAALASGDVQNRLTSARTAYDAGNRSAMSGATDLVAMLMQGLRVAKDNAVPRTNAAITQENQLKMDGSARANGERRGPPGTAEPPLPTPADVSSAAETQYDNIVGLVEREVAAVNILL